MRSKTTATAVVALSLTLSLSLAACGSDDADPEEANSGQNTGQSGSGQSDGGDREFPDGFPEEVPVPAGEIRSGSAVGDVGWRLMVVVPLDADEEALKAEYTTLYEDAGFTVTNEGTNINLQATNDDWRVDLVVRPPTITVQVLKP